MFQYAEATNAGGEQQKVTSERSHVGMKHLLAVTSWKIQDFHFNVLSSSCMHKQDCNIQAKYDYQGCIYLSSLLLPMHLTPASSLWLQLWRPIPLLGQESSVVSAPLHCTLSKRMGPVPAPKAAPENATAPAHEKVQWFRTVVAT